MFCRSTTVPCTVSPHSSCRCIEVLHIFCDRLNSHSQSFCCETSANVIQKKIGENGSFRNVRCSYQPDGHKPQHIFCRANFCRLAFRWTLHSGEHTLEIKCAMFHSTCFVLWPHCFVACSSFFLFSVLMVILQPFDTCFKKTKFVQKNILIMETFCKSISIMITVLTWFFDGYLPNGMCSMFVGSGEATLMKHIAIFLSALGQMSCLAFILTVHTKIILAQKKQQRIRELSASKTTSNKSMISQLAIFSVSHIATWTPNAIIHIYFAFQRETFLDSLSWATISLTPVNAIVVSSTFITTTKRKLKRESHNKQQVEAQKERWSHTTHGKKTACRSRVTQSYDCKDAVFVCPAPKSTVLCHSITWLQLWWIWFLRHLSAPLNRHKVWLFSFTFPCRSVSGTGQAVFMWVWHVEWNKDTDNFQKNSII